MDLAASCQPVLAHPWVAAQAVAEVDVPLAVVAVDLAVAEWAVLTWVDAPTVVELVVPHVASVAEAGDFWTKASKRCCLTPVADGVNHAGSTSVLKRSTCLATTFRDE